MSCSLVICARYSTVRAIPSTNHGAPELVERGRMVGALDKNSTVVIVVNKPRTIIKYKSRNILLYQR